MPDAWNSALLIVTTPAALMVCGAPSCTAVPVPGSSRKVTVPPGMPEVAEATVAVSTIVAEFAGPGLSAATTVVVVAAALTVNCTGVAGELPA